VLTAFPHRAVPRRRLVSSVVPRYLSIQTNYSRLTTWRYSRRTTMLDWYWVLLIGIGGGLLNATVIEGNVLWYPRRRRGRDGTALDPGFLRNVGAGVGAAYIAWLISITSGSQWTQQALLAFGGAIGGASTLSSYTQKEKAAVAKQAQDVASETVRELTEL